MKLLPKSNAARLRFAFIVALLISLVIFCRLDRVVIFYLSDKHEGDIVFQSLPHAELVNAIETVTNSPWSHCGILVKQKGHWYVAEAINDVHYTPLYVWMVRGRRSYVDSYRVRLLNPAEIDKLKSTINKFLGMPYAYSYEASDSDMYCSELVYKAYDQALGIKIGVWQKLGDLNWKPMADFIRSMDGGHLPLDRKMITPVELTRSPEVHRVFTNRD